MNLQLLRTAIDRVNLTTYPTPFHRFSVKHISDKMLIFWENFVFFSWKSIGSIFTKIYKMIFGFFWPTNCILFSTWWQWPARVSILKIFFEISRSQFPVISISLSFLEKSEREKNFTPFSRRKKSEIWHQVSLKKLTIRGGCKTQNKVRQE